MTKSKEKTDKILLVCFAVSMAAYIAIFVTAFVELPINIPPWHQLLLLCFHFIPMFFLQLLLCMKAKLRWKFLIPLALLAVPGVIFLSYAEWAVMGWLLFLFWCAAPVLGCAFAWIIWAISRIAKGRKKLKQD